MDPRSNNAGLGLPQPGNDMGPLPPINTPQFHAPDTAAPHFAAAEPQLGTAAPSAAPQAIASPAVPQPSTPTPTPLPTAADPQIQAGAVSAGELAGPADEDDTAFDEEWVGRARDVVGKTKNDPYLQSQELSKVKAQYIKLRYNKDIKVSE